MEQRLVTMEHRQTKALDAIASHLKMEHAIAAHLNINGKSNLSNITEASEYV